MSMKETGVFSKGSNISGPKITAAVVEQNCSSFGV